VQAFGFDIRVHFTERNVCHETEMRKFHLLKELEVLFAVRICEFDDFHSSYGLATNYTNYHE